MNDFESARTLRFIPLTLNEGVIAQMRIVRVNGRRVSTGTGAVFVVSLSPKGLQILTYLRLPPAVRWQLWLRFRLEGEELRLVGTVRSGKAVEHGWWRYEVETDSDPAVQTRLIGVLNRRLLRLYPEPLRRHQLYVLHTLQRSGD